jgi:hypothetical protein
MKAIHAIVLTSLILLPINWQPAMTATNDPKAAKVVDASGNLRVPGDYRTAYQFLGSWAVAADQTNKPVNRLARNGGIVPLRDGQLGIASQCPADA